MRKKVFTSIIATVSFLSAMTTVAAEEAAALKVACIGDSITFGAGVKQRKSNSFPAQLGAMLGKGYEVKNFGVSASTMLKNGNKPYWNLPQFKTAQEYKPDVVIIKLGTNDTKPDNWKHKAEFKTDYCEMIKIFQSLENKPDVWICYPVPVFPTGERWKWGINDPTVKEEIIPLIDEIAQTTGANVIDLYQPLVGKPDLVPDNVHPNASGAKVIAETIFSAMTGESS